MSKKKNKELSSKERNEIRNWISITTTNYMFPYDGYSDVEPEDEDELQETEEYIEKEHEDYMLIKTQELEAKMVANQAT